MSGQAMSEDLLPVVQKAYDLNLWLLPQIERFNRGYRFTVGDRLQAASLDLCLALIEAGHARQRGRALHRASRLLDQLRVLFRLSRDLKLISSRKHEHVSGRTAEIGRMLGGWIRAS